MNYYLINTEVACYLLLALCYALGSPMWMAYLLVALVALTVPRH